MCGVDTHKVLDADVAASEDECGHSLAVARAGGLVQGRLTLLEHGGG